METTIATVVTVRVCLCLCVRLYLVPVSSDVSGLYWSLHNPVTDLWVRGMFLPPPSGLKSLNVCVRMHLWGTDTKRKRHRRFRKSQIEIWAFPVLWMCAHHRECEGRLSLIYICFCCHVVCVWLRSAGAEMLSFLSVGVCVWGGVWRVSVASWLQSLCIPRHIRHSSP